MVCVHEYNISEIEFTNEHMCLLGMPCDNNGDDLPPNAPPNLQDSNCDPTDWTPYESRTQFEVANFLYKRNQMSAGDIDFLLNLWAATLARHDDHPPFSNHEELYSTIDATPLGDVPWESFSLKYNGILPDHNIPPWMTSEYDVWFRDPNTLVRNLISNPDFRDEFDYSPLREFDTAENRRYQDFMSGNWAWKQAVCDALKYINDI